MRKRERKEEEMRKRARGRKKRVREGDREGREGGFWLAKIAVSWQGWMETKDKREAQ